jgi:hypothetical protein
MDVTDLFLGHDVRILIEYGEVSELAGGDAADLLLHTKRVGRIDRYHVKQLVHADSLARTTDLPRETESIDRNLNATP